MKEDLKKIKALPYVKTASYKDGYFFVTFKPGVLTMKLHHKPGRDGGWQPIRTKHKPRIILPQYEVRMIRSSYGHLNWGIRLVNKPKLIVADYAWKVTTNAYGNELGCSESQAQNHLTTNWYAVCEGAWESLFREEKDATKFLDIIAMYLQCARPDGDGLVRRAQWAEALSLEIKP